MTYIQQKFLKYFFFLFLLPLHSCAQKEEEVQLYELDSPVVMELEQDLDEISGITMVDGSLYAISDEKGNLFQLDPGTGKVIKTWKFSEVRDFEGLAAHDNRFYVLESNGNITEIEISGDAVSSRKFDFNLAKGEFEIFYYDKDRGKFILICKDCKDDGKSEVSAFTFDPSTKAFAKADFLLSASAVHALGNGKNERIKASGGAMHPSTGEVFIVSSINKFLLVKNKEAKPVRIYQLNRKLFEQPEGISFNSNGDMFISNEKGGKKSATLLFFKMRK